MSTHHYKQRGYLALSLVFLLCLSVCALPVPAAAAGSRQPVPCFASTDRENVTGYAVGIPALMDTGTYILVPTDFYAGDGALHLVQYNEELCEIQYDGTFGAFGAFSVSISGEDSAFYDTSVSPVVGESYTLVGMTSSGDMVRRSATITEYAGKDSTGLYRVGFEADTSDIVALAVIVDGQDRIVAICSQEGTYALDEPVDSGGSGNGSGGDSGSGSSGNSGSSGGTSDVKPGRDSEKSSGKRSASTVAVYAGCGVAVLLVIIAIVNGKKKKPSSGTANSVPAQNVPVNPPAAPQVPVRPAAPAPKREEPVYVPSAPPAPPAPAVVKLSLDVVSGPMAGQRYTVSDMTLLIGRAQEANIQYPADTKGVSRRHCQVFWKNGSLHIMDLGSTAGTFLRGKGKLMPNTPVPLTAGDTVYLGSKQVALQLNAQS